MKEQEGKELCTGSAVVDTSSVSSHDEILVLSACEELEVDDTVVRGALL